MNMDNFHQMSSVGKVMLNDSSITIFLMQSEITLVLEKNLFALI